MEKVEIKISNKNINMYGKTEYYPMLTIGFQTFYLKPVSTKKSAKFFCEMLSNAISKLTTNL